MCVSFFVSLTEKAQADFAAVLFDVQIAQGGEKGATKDFRHAGLCA